MSHLEAENLADDREQDFTLLHVVAGGVGWIRFQVMRVVRGFPVMWFCTTTATMNPQLQNSPTKEFISHAGSKADHAGHVVAALLLEKVAHKIAHKIKDRLSKKMKDHAGKIPHNPAKSQRERRQEEGALCAKFIRRQRNDGHEEAEEDDETEQNQNPQKGRTSMVFKGLEFLALMQGEEVSAGEINGKFILGGETSRELWKLFLFNQPEPLMEALPNPKKEKPFTEMNVRQVNSKVPRHQKKHRRLALSSHN